MDDLLFKLVPLIFSAFAVCILQKKIPKTGDRLIFAAFAILFFHIIAAWVVVLSPGLNVSIFEFSDIAYFTLGALLVWMVAAKARPTFPKFAGESLNSFQALVYFCAILSFAVLTYIAASLPGVAWDSLDHWMPEASRLLNILAEGTQREFSARYIHPSTGVGILAWFSGHSSALAGGSLKFLVGLLPIIIIVLSCVGILINLNVRGLPIMVAVALVLTMPLGSNHVVGYGYVDIWTAANVVLALAAMMAFIGNPSIVRLVFVMICIALIAVWRNNAVIYIAPLLLSLVSWGYINTSKAGKLLWIIIFILSFMWAEAHMTPFLNLQRFGLGNFGLDYRGEGIRLWIGYRVLELAIQDSTVVFDSLFHAFFFNASFSTIAILWLLSFVWTIRNRNNSPSEAFISIIFSSYLMLTFISSLYLSPFFLNSYAMPDSDTGLSRFMLAWIYSAMPLISYVFANSSQAPQYGAARDPSAMHADTVPSDIAPR